jgi:hypothetical protein
MLDDDSSPTPGSLERMVRAFREDPRLGALGFRVLLPGGEEETAGAWYAFIGCGVGFRTEALRRAGGYPKGYVFYVEEYDLAFRIMAAGYRVQWYGDVAVEHRKAEGNRRLGRILYYLVRNNLWLWPRFFPLGPALGECRRLTARYLMAGRKEGALGWCLAGLAAGAARLPLALAGRRLLDPGLVAQIRGDEFLLTKMRQLADKKGARRIGLLGFTRDAPRFWRAARRAGLEVEGVYDQLLSAYRKRFRGAPVRPLAELGGSRADVLVTASTSPGAGLYFERRARDLGARQEVVHFFPFKWVDEAPPGLAKA